MEGEDDDDDDAEASGSNANGEEEDEEEEDEEEEAEGCSSLYLHHGYSTVCSSLRGDYDLVVHEILGHVAIVGAEEKIDFLQLVTDLRGVVTGQHHKQLQSIVVEIEFTRPRLAADVG